MAGPLVINGPLSRRDLAAPGSAPRPLAGMAASVAVLFGVMVATALSLEAAGVSYPGTIAATIASATN